MSIPKKVASFLFFVGFLLILTGSNQAQTLARASWVAMGSSLSTSNFNSLAVQQSIGQSSVIGSYNGGSLQVNQGFLQGRRELAKELIPHFGVLAFPNSFSEQIHFRFSQTHQEATQVRVYDIQGRLVFEAICIPQQNEVALNLSFLASGTYITHLKSGNKMVQTRIIKKP